MKNNVLKPFILSLFITVVCFQFTACGNQSDSYNADETTNSHMESSTNNIKEDGINDSGSGSGSNLGQDIENAGDAIMDGAEDLLDGDTTENNSNEQNGTNAQNGTNTHNGANAQNGTNENHNQ